jgi:hypothetical protein
MSRQNLRRVLRAEDFARAVVWGKSTMSTDLPAALADEAKATDVAARSGLGAWVETALSVLFTVTAVLLVSFVAVVTSL